MIDIWLGDDGDLILTEEGDILIAPNVAQAINTRLLWILGEWRFNPEYGFPWFEEVFVKKPDLEGIQQTIRDTVIEVDGVSDCEVEVESYDEASRKITFKYKADTVDGLLTEEVELDG